MGHMGISARKRIWGWYFFDWASQPYSTLLLTFIFGPYFAHVATQHFMAAGADGDAARASAQALWGTGLTLSGLLIAVLSPVLGAIADGSGRRMVWIWAFSLLYVLGAGGLWYLTPTGDFLTPAVALFGIGLIGMEFATTFTNALLPGLGNEEEIGALSGSGFAFGYLGGVLSLILTLVFLAESGDSGRTLAGLRPGFGLLDPATMQGTRFVGPLTALWYIIFMIPFFLWVKEPRRAAADRVPPMAALRGLWASVLGLGRRHSLRNYLLSSMFYRDALNGLFSFGGVYAYGVLGWSTPQIGLFGILGAVTATLASWWGGRLDARFGPKPVITGSVLVLIGVCLVVVGMNRESLFGMPLQAGSSLPDLIFYLCGALIGGAGGTVQAASRTLVVRHTSPERAAETFGLFAFTGKATAFLAPGLITLATALSRDQQIGITPLIGLFLLGIVLLAWVNPKGEPRP